MALFPPEPSSFSGPEARFLRQPPLPALSRVYTRLPASTPLTWPSCLGPGSPDLALSPPCSEKQRKREILEQTDMCDQDTKLPNGPEASVKLGPLEGVHPKGSQFSVKHPSGKGA